MTGNRFLLGLVITVILLVSVPSASAYTLGVFGNANEDETVDLKDVEYAASVVLGLDDQTQLADAKCDGEIDILDVTQIELIMLGKEKKLTLLDMIDRTVTIPRPINRVVTISDGLVESTMIIFGVEDTLVGLGSSCVQRDFEYSYTTNSGEEFTYSGGKNTAGALCPELKDLPLVAQSSTGINYETIAGLDPDIIILISGSCTCGCSETDEKTMKSIEMIESLAIPVVVLSTPNCCDADIGAIYESIHILGGVFSKWSEAENLASILEGEVEFIRDRTENISDDEKPRVLYLNLMTLYGGGATVGSVTGIDMIESIFLEDIVNAKNAFDGIGKPSMSSEQILALDPDVIMLPTCRGYHPAREVYEGESLTDLQDLKVVREKQIYSLPWTPCRCGERLEFPIDLIIEAKACYPDIFSDIIVSDWVIDFYMKVYDVDEDTAGELRSAQWLDWMTEEDF
ncbi:MAG TPA: iron ABC transporter substrate-binding protein [Methanosarcinaceae archaeon]|nr:iron ABC transporter substrate-binding protein [Methanosarcinaceae archaeon]